MNYSTGDFTKLFIDKSHHREILVDAGDSTEGSRIGGRPPAILAAGSQRCPLCGGPMSYVLTLAGDLLGDEIADGKAVSLLACREYECLCKSHRLITPSSTALVVHEDDSRAIEASELDFAPEGRRLTLGKMEPDPPSDDGWGVATDAAKLGGGPGYIQSWGAEEASKADGRVFLFQWSENALAIAYRTRGLKSGPHVFLGGVVYVFSRTDPATGRPKLVDLAAFWQNT
jgi:hypothetical protein